MAADDKSDGPSMLHYIDTRLQGIDDSAKAFARATDDRFRHLEQLLTLGQDNAKRAVDKAEAAQQAHNLSANEWRGTLNDFKSTLIGRSEFERLYEEFSAYRLEQSRQQSMSAGAKEQRKESTDSWKAIAALVIAFAAVVMTYIFKHG